MSDETPDEPTGGTWTESVNDFEAEATWLTGVDRPQLVALRAIAAALDNGTFQAALISQFTLIHRDLVKRRPDGRREVDDLDAAVDAMEHNPGAFWKPTA